MATPFHVAARWNWDFPGGVVYFIERSVIRRAAR